VSSEGSGPGDREGRQQGIASAITEVSERASVLIREEIELAKTEISEKATRLAKGAVVGIVAGVFFFTALFFVLIGCAWLLYYELPIGNEFTYFWGFFAMALILVVLGAIAGWLAAKAVKSGAPPTPDMAIQEARKIRDTVSASTGSSPGVSDSQAGASKASGEPPRPPIPVPGSPPPTPPTPKPTPPAPTPPKPTPPAPMPSDSDLGRGVGDGPTHSG
jgi:hypothetical protein